MRQVTNDCNKLLFEIQTKPRVIDAKNTDLYFNGTDYIACPASAAWCQGGLNVTFKDPFIND